MPNQADDPTAVTHLLIVCLFWWYCLYVWYLKFQYKDLYSCTCPVSGLQKVFWADARTRFSKNLCLGSCFNQALCSSQGTVYYAGISLFMHKFSRLLGRSEAEPLSSVWMDAGMNIFVGQRGGGGWSREHFSLIDLLTSTAGPEPSPWTEKCFHQ